MTLILYILHRHVNSHYIGEVFYLTAVADKRMVTLHITILQQFGKGKIEKNLIVRGVLWFSSVENAKKICIMQSKIFL